MKWNLFRVQIKIHLTYYDIFGKLFNQISIIIKIDQEIADSKMSNQIKCIIKFPYTLT